jgi:SAM-dependent methyltransferase
VSDARRAAESAALIAAGGDAGIQTAVLEAMSFAPAYHRWIVDWFGTALAGHIVEVGAGDGTVTRLLLQSNVAQVTALEPDAERAAGLRAAFAREPAVRVVAGGTSSPDLPRDIADATVVYVNVLEHVADDVAELRRAALLAGAEGRVCIFAPALPSLYSRLDAELGHHRRYTRSSLRAAAESAGLRVERMAYFDRAGALAWWLLHRVAGLRINPGSASRYDRLVPLLRRLDTVLPLPFGKNLICECRRG